MENFFTRLFGRKEPEVFTISMADIPSWLDGREKTARSALLSTTGEPQKKIRDAIASLQQITHAIERAEQEEELHPKLKSIARNSLPQYVKAMNTSLAKELPDTIEEFYSAAAECLKSCMNSTRGQGRYLQAVFPEEMKTIRAGIGVIGHEINAITASLAQFRKEKTLIDEALALHTGIRDISGDMEKADEKEKRIMARIAEIRDRITAIDSELVAFSADERVAEVEMLKTAIRDTEARRDAAIRTNAALSMTASHVFRKAEKIAVRQKHSSEIAVLKTTMEILSDHEIADPTDLRSALLASCPIAGRMIAEGEIPLKNKEERAIFSNTTQFTADICENCTNLKVLEDACRTAEETLAKHPLVVRTHSLEREKAQLETMLAKENQAGTGLEEWRIKTRDKIPELTGELKKKLEDIAGVGVQLQIDDQGLA